MDSIRTKSKDTNTFRFKTFAERVSELDIRQSTLYHIGHANEDLNEEIEDETLFSYTLRKWSVLNLSVEYSSFARKCHGIVTLPQLLYKREHVVTVLLEALDTSTVLSLEPILDVLTAFARDIREEFYPHFDDFFRKLVHLLQAQDAEQLEWTLKCLAHLFKTLRPFLKRNIGVVLSRVIPLLDDTSNPDYVVNFASECFSFVVRDIKDYQKLLAVVLKYLQKHSVGYSGCGKLFFELIRGVNGNFHSVAKDFLRSLLEAFSNFPNDADVLFDITTRTITEMLEHISFDRLSLFWDTIVEVTQGKVEQSGEDTDSILCLVRLMRLAVDWKNGRAISDVGQLISLIVKIVDRIENEDILLELTAISATILQSNAVKLQQMDASRLICKMLSVSLPSIYEQFVWSICQHAQFEILVQPNVVAYFEAEPDIRRLDLLVRVVEKRLNRNVQDMWRKHPIQLKRPRTLSWIQNNIEAFKFNKSTGRDLEAYVLSTMIYPHLVDTGNADHVCRLLQTKILGLNFRQMEEKSYIIAIYTSIQAILALELTVPEVFFEKVITGFLETSCKDPAILVTLSIIFDCVARKKKSLFTDELFVKVTEKLRDNLCSSSYLSRLLTTKIFAQFNDGGLDEQKSVYGIFYEATNIRPTVHNYRDQLLLFDQFSANGKLFQSIKSIDIQQDCLRFLLGILYEKFKLVWDPVSKHIEELAEKLSPEHFWDVYHVRLVETTSSIRSNTSPGSGTDAFDCVAVQSISEQLNPAVDNVDFIHYRSLLWKNLANFGLLSEVKNKDVVSLFLDFVENEYRKEDKSSALTWNLMSTELHESDPDESVRKNKRGKVDGHKSAGTTLAIMLGVFSKMANPKQLYREPEIRELYYDLLAGTNEQLQKLSLDCLMRYKLKACMPYKDHLYALIDDKKFKDELINLKLDAESKIVDPDHRSELMPILLRILYGRMRSKTGNKYLGSQMRRSIILRFLAGCTTDEILWFLQMAFRNYQDILADDIEMIPVKISNNFSLHQVLSPKKLQSALNLLDITRKSFGGLMQTDFLIYLLKLIVLGGAVCRNVFENSTRIDTNLLKVFRNLRAQCLQSLVAFFEHFEELVWQPGHLKVCFDVFVWPLLRKLPDECLHTPTPLLKLFITWSQNVRNYKLLAEKHEDDTTPLGTVLLLLVSDKPSRLIRKTVLDMVERILLIEEEESRDNEKKAPSIIAPYITQILQRLTQILNTKGSRRAFGKTELFVLSKITEMDLSAEMSEMLLNLVLPIVTGKARVSASELGVSQLVVTVRNLLLKTRCPENHVRSLMPLFEKVTDIATRKLLCKLFNEVHKKSGKKFEYLLELADIAAKLNAWDRKWIEQPDYEKRLTALRSVRERAETSQINIELGLLVIHNCFYFLHHDKDLGLRDNACMCLRSLVPKLLLQNANNVKEVNYLLEDVMFNLIRRTLRDKNDVIRNEGILLLGEMARNCPDMHPVLADLHPLSSKEDAEVDFFENLTHLQSHRHGRALLKFCSYAKECEKPLTTRTLTNFLLPLTTRYLLSEKSAAKHTLVDAAIETLGMICRFLPWHQYHTLLKYYLQKMRHCQEYHKQCIRIIISILDAFHFDLSAASGVPLQSEPLDQPGSEVIDEDAEKDEEKDEDLDSELDEIAEGDMDDDDDDQQMLPAKKIRLNISFVEQLTKLSPSAAKNVIHTITSNLIPSLNNSITALSSYESKHKLNRRRVNLEREEEESLRVPIALAIAKLLKKLPKNHFEANIPGVFLKACTFLKSPVKSVRMLTRDILKKMMMTVGPEYLSMVLSQLTVLLTRGFQVHVLSVTLFGILDCLKDQLKPQHVEHALRYILDVSLNDIFGDASAEKEIDKIGSSTPEAKPSAKSYLSLQIASQSIPENCLLDLLVPFKDQLYRTQSKKVVMKVQDCFQKITSGLAENPNITSESLLQFIYGMISQSIPDLLLPQTTLDHKEKELMKRRPADCLLIPQEPKFRSGVVRKVVKTNASANAYVLIEFGLELLNILLRRKKFDSTDCLEPFVSMLEKSLESTHLRICILSLKCLIIFWTSNTELSSLKASIDSIVKQIFAILHKYFNFGVTRKDDNFQLVKNAMKAIGCIIKNCEYYQVSDEHVTQILFYVGQDVNESDRQPVAFSLLKSLIERHKSSKELHEIMLKLCEISITSESSYAQNEARAVLLNYVAEFQREKRVESILKFFIAQLNYEIIAGRISAVKFIESSVKKYSADVMSKKAEVIFLALGTRFVNEDSPECRILIAQSLEELITRLPKVNRDKLFEITATFFESEKAAVKEMGASLCSRFIQVEKEEFLPRAKHLLPTLATSLELSSPNAAGKFVRATTASPDLDDNDNAVRKDERAVDHSIIQIQNCIIKILANCPQTLAESSLTNTIDSIAYESKKLLAYDHEWVRLNSVIILNHILPTYDLKMLEIAVSTDESTDVRQFICSDPAGDLKSLTLDLCAQMVPGEISEDIAQEISKTLLFLANIMLSIEKLQLETNFENVNLHWLMRRVRYALHGEVAKAPKSTVLRQSLFDWFESLVTLLDAQQLLDLCPPMIASLIRELSEDDTNIDPLVKQKAMKVSKRIQKKIGDENYDRIRLDTQNKLLMKRAARKVELAQEKILDPVRSAKRKESLQERKKIAKRRRIDEARGKSKLSLTKKRKKKSLDDIF